MKTPEEIKETLSQLGAHGKSNFATYEEAVYWARWRANRMRISHYVKKNTGGLIDYAPWVIGMLPRPENRYGSELLWEAVEPDPIKKMF